MLAPLWVAAWYGLYRVLAPAAGFGILRGGALAWDLFIPFLVYLCQFGALHAARSVAVLRERTEREHALRDGARRAELAALRAQLQPHFLFNTLNSIAASVPPEHAATRGLVTRLAALMRYALDASRREAVLMRDEIDFTAAYLALEAERLGERLAVEYSLIESRKAIRRACQPSSVAPRPRA